MLTKEEYLRSLKIVSFTKKKALMLFLLTLFIALVSHISFFIFSSFSFDKATVTVGNNIKDFFSQSSKDTNICTLDDVILDVSYTPSFSTKEFGDEDISSISYSKFDEVVPQIRPINTNLYEIRFVNKKDLLKNQ